MTQFYNGFFLLAPKFQNVLIFLEIQNVNQNRLQMWRKGRITASNLRWYASENHL